MVIRIYLSLLLLTFSLSCHAQLNVRKLDRKVEKIFRRSSFPGLAIAIVDGDSVVFSKAYGYADVKSKTPFTEQTIMPIGSVSKTVIAFALIQAMEQGYFSAETPINELLPFKIENPHQSNDTIRVEHLFTHTSGILDNEVTFIGSNQLNKKPNESLATFLRSCLSEDGARYQKSNFDSFKADSKYNYSNIGSALAAYLIEVQAGMSFDEFTQKHLFQPLRLTQTHWFYDEEHSKDYATLYEINIPDEPFYENLVHSDKSLKHYSSILYPDGSLRTSLNDLMLYVKELLKGLDNASALLSESSYSALFQKRFDESAFPENVNSSIVNQAMFWTYNKKGRLTHNGSDPGLFTVVTIDPKTRIGRVVMINANIDTEENREIIENLRKVSEALEDI